MRSIHTPYRRQSAWMPVLTVWFALRARFRLLAFTSGTLFVLLAGIILTMPKQYESRMELFLGERDLPEAPSSLNERGDRTAYLHDVLVNSEVELLRSAGVLTNVVLKTGLQKLEVAEDGSSGLTSALTLDKALRRLQRNLTIVPVEKSNIVQLSYFAPTPEIAQNVLKTLAASYPARLIQVRSKPSMVGYLQRQSYVWRDALTVSESALIRCRRLYSGTVMPEEREEFSKRALEAQSLAEQADAEAADCQQRVYKQQKQLDQYLSKPRGTRGSQGVHAGDETNLLSAADLGMLQRRLLVDRAELAGLETRLERLKRIAKRYRVDLMNLASASVEHDALMREVNQSAQTYIMYAKKAEETKLSEALSRGRIANLSLADGPTLPLQPSRAGLIQDSLLALLGSLGSGVLVVMLVELVTVGSLRSHQAVQSLYDDNHQRYLGA